MNTKLESVFREDSDLLLDNGFYIKFVTMNHNSPPHWHRAIEILYILNGKASVNLDDGKHKLMPLDFIAIDSTRVHDVVYAMPQSMGICIHISKNFLRRYLPDIELWRFRCSVENLTEEQKEPYNKLCEYMKDLTLLYMHQTQSYQLRCNALVLEILAILVEHFGSPATEGLTVSGYNKLNRMEQIYQYVEHHHAEELTLQDGADLLGVSKEHFCRFFKENMGISFITYVNQVRIDHIYQDLIHTDDSILEITERHGFFNQKLFYRMFKERYDCTPVKLRKLADRNPYLQ